MRINVYHEELTNDVRFIYKYVPETQKTYWGLRMFMKSPDELHHTAEDDDRTAITFWFGTKKAALNFFESTVCYVKYIIENQD